MELPTLPQTVAQAGLSALEEMGLAKKCDHCDTPKRLLSQLVRFSKDLTVTVDAYPETYPNGKRVNVPCNLDAMELRCARCKDTGVVPTDKGWRLIGLVKMFLEDASGKELGREEEIAF